MSHPIDLFLNPIVPDVDPTDPPSQRQVDYVVRRNYPRDDTENRRKKRNEDDYIVRRDK